MKAFSARALALTALAISLLPTLVWAETLAEVKRRNFLEVCAGPDALPYSSQTTEPQGFQLDLARVVAEDLGVGLRVDWIVYTRFAQRTNCDALMGVIIKDGGTGLRGVKLTVPYTGSGWVLVLPKDAPPSTSFEDVQGQKGVGVQYSSWVHYILDTRKIKTRQFQDDHEILEALSKGEISAGAVVNTYAGWRVHLHPDEGIKLVQGYTPESELRWNVAVGLRNADQPLIDAVNDILRRRMADGTVKTIMQRYGIPYYPPFEVDAAKDLKSSATGEK